MASCGFDGYQARVVHMYTCRQNAHERDIYVALARVTRAPSPQSHLSSCHKQIKCRFEGPTAQSRIEEVRLLSLGKELCLQHCCVSPRWSNEVSDGDARKQTADLGFKGLFPLFFSAVFFISLFTSMESGLGFPRREGGCVSPGDGRERATSSNGLVRGGAHTHWALEEKAVLGAQTPE